MARRSRQDTRPALERLGILDSAEQIKRNSRRYKTREHKDAITAGVIEAMLLRHAQGVEQLDASRVKALEILLDRRKPRLSSVDSTVTTKESYTDTLRRIVDARNQAQPAPGELIPLLKDQA